MKESCDLLPRPKRIELRKIQGLQGNTIGINHDDLDIDVLVGSIRNGISGVTIQRPVVVNGDRRDTKVEKGSTSEAAMPLLTSKQPVREISPEDLKR
jgi:hypothetical protein